MTTWINFPENPEDYVGFVYLIENIHPDVLNEDASNHPKRFYIGKKQLLRKVKMPANGSRKRPKTVWKDNGAEDYYGSSRGLLEAIERYGKEYFTRTVIECCTSKFHMSYAEICWQIECNALMDPSFYNGVLNCRISKAPKGFVDIERKRINIGL